MKQTFEEHKKIMAERRVYCMGGCKRFRRNKGHFGYHYICTACIRTLSHARRCGVEHRHYN